MPFPRNPGAEMSAGRMLQLLCLLWLAGMAMRITILAVPPVIPLIRNDLGKSETQVGLLIGLPLVAWALAAVPGSLLIARLGATATLAAGLAVTALAAAARGGAASVWLLYLATIVMGLGIAVMQPAVPTLVREWLPDRVGLGAAVVTNGMLAGGTLGAALTIPLVLPLVEGSWRLNLVAWGVPVLLALVLLPVLARPTRHWTRPAISVAGRWWPNWRSPVVWLLGFTFGSNNALFFGANAFLPDYLVNIGRADLTGAALGWMNGCQLIASTLLLATAEYLQGRAWPYLLFGPAALAAVIGIVSTSGTWIVASAALLGFALAVTFVVTFALPPLLSPHGDVHRTAAGMFTISYGCALAIPIVCGASWDLTGRSWTAFVPLGICAVTLTVIGLVLSLHRPAGKTR
jgi:CP family cyanate transporter-like MFS transporter